MESKQELWLLNLSKADVSISDLGIKVPIGKAVNVYKANPYLTAQQVEKSMKSGALAKRLSGTKPILKIVKKASTARPAALDKIKQSKEPVKIKKTKSSVVIDSSAQEENTDGEKFDFADYGVSVGSDASQVREQSSVFVKAKEDQQPAGTGSDVVTKPKVDSNISKQSAVVMDTMAKNFTDPVGPLAKMTTKNNSPYVVAKPPAPAKEKVVKEQVQPKTKVAKETGAVMVDAVKEVKKSASVKVKRAEDGGEAKIEMAQPKIDAKVATKTDGGAIIMDLKEVKPSKKK